MGIQSGRIVSLAPRGVIVTRIMMFAAYQSFVFGQQDCDAGVDLAHCQ